MLHTEGLIKRPSGWQDVKENDLHAGISTVYFFIMRGMSKRSSDRLNFARKGHETVACAHSYFVNIPEGVYHVLIAVASWSC